MGNSKSFPIKTINQFVTLYFIKEDGIEIFPLKLREIKKNSDIKFLYFIIGNKERSLIEKNYPFNLIVINRINNKEEKFYFCENYRFNDTEYSISNNVIDNHKWYDYSINNRKDVKIRHNKHIEPVEVIISE